MDKANGLPVQNGIDDVKDFRYDPQVLPFFLKRLFFHEVPIHAAVECGSLSPAFLAGEGGGRGRQHEVVVVCVYPILLHNLPF